MAWQRNSIAAGAHVAVVRAEQLDRMKKDALCPSARQLLQKSLSQLRGQGAGQLAKVCCVSVTPPHQITIFSHIPSGTPHFLIVRAGQTVGGRDGAVVTDPVRSWRGDGRSTFSYPVVICLGIFGHARFPLTRDSHHSPAASFPRTGSTGTWA